MASELALRNDIPVPETVLAADQQAVQDFVKRHKDFVVKPADGAHGRGVSVGVDESKLEAAISLAAESAKAGGVLLQQRIIGSDLRVLVIGGKCVAAVRRMPASVIGDGQHTLRELIAIENDANPERGLNDEKRFSKIDLDASNRFLGDRLDSQIPAKAEETIVVGTANIGAGGYAVDYTDKITPAIKAAAEKFAMLVSVAACGVDFIWEEPGAYYFIEANACPGFNLHIDPTEGTSRPVAQYFVDFLLSQSAPAWHDKPAAVEAGEN
jgi:cyanophycin synthetase